MINESNISDLVRNSDLNTKFETLATKAELKADQDKIVELQTHDLSCFLDKNIFVMMVFKIFFLIGQWLTHLS